MMIDALLATFKCRPTPGETTHTIRNRCTTRPWRPQKPGRLRRGEHQPDAQHRRVHCKYISSTLATQTLIQQIRTRERDKPLGNHSPRIDNTLPGHIRGVEELAAVRGGQILETDADLAGTLSWRNWRNQRVKFIIGTEPRTSRFTMGSNSRSSRR